LSGLATANGVIGFQILDAGVYSFSVNLLVYGDISNELHISLFLSDLNTYADLAEVDAYVKAGSFRKSIRFTRVLQMSANQQVGFVIGSDLASLSGDYDGVFIVGTASTEQDNSRHNFCSIHRVDV
jgi:hypothetical protein